MKLRLNERYICEAVCDAVREWSEVTRPSADCQTTFFRRFKQLETNLKKVVERSRDSGRRSRDRRLTVKQHFLDVSSNLGKFWKKSLNGHARVVGGHATISRLSNNVFSTFQANKKIFWKKSLNGHVTVVGGRATVGRLSNNDFSTFQAIWENFEKSRWTVTRQWSEVTRPSADCQTIFFGRFKQFGKILKKVAWTVTRQRSEVTQPSADCQTTFFWTFQAIWENFEKSRWTVTRQWSEVTRPSADCQTTFFGRFKQLENFLKKVAERSRDSGRRSRGCRPTVKQRF